MHCKHLYPCRTCSNSSGDNTQLTAKRVSPLLSTTATWSANPASSPGFNVSSYELGVNNVVPPWLCGVKVNVPSNVPVSVIEPSSAGTIPAYAFHCT